MEYRSRFQWFVMVIIVIAILALTIFGIVALIRKITTPSTPSEPVSNASSFTADNNNSSSYMRLTVNGSVVANEKRQSVQIDIAQNNRNVKFFSGYEQNVANQQFYDNNANAYSSFLSAIFFAGFTKEREGATTTDPTGVCASGKQYIFEVYNAGQNTSNLWTTSCGSKSGTSSGSASSIYDLFKKQIPNYNDLMNAIDYSL